MSEWTDQQIPQIANRIVGEAESGRHVDPARMDWAKVNGARTSTGQRVIDHANKLLSEAERGRYVEPRALDWAQWIAGMNRA